MKKIFKSLVFVIAATISTFSVNGKSAILIAHYGSSDLDTRAKTLDLITSDIRKAFPGHEVMEAYISPVVRRNLAASGIITESPAEVLARLYDKGVDTVYVQSTTLIDGTEMADLRAACNEASKYFKVLRCGESLCYTPSDCEEVVTVLTSMPCEDDGAIIYVGHGNLLPSTATYSQLDYMFKAIGYTNFYMSTIEGYPRASTTAKLLKDAGLSSKKLKLVPFLLVCGNHTKKDIAGDFAAQLKEAGFSVEVLMKGLGENPLIRRLYVDRIRRLIGID